MNKLGKHIDRLEADGFNRLSVINSVGNSAWYSVMDSVYYSIDNFVSDSIWHTVWLSMGEINE